MAVRRRAELAFALILLLVLAPLAGAACGLRCMTAAAPHSLQHAATQQRPCATASVCCHKRSASLCSTAIAPDAAAFLPASAPASHDVIAFSPVSAQSPLQSFRQLVGSEHDASPPGQSLASSPIPLRI